MRQLDQIFDLIEYLQEPRLMDEIAARLFTCRRGAYRHIKQLREAGFTVTKKHRSNPYRFDYQITEISQPFKEKINHLNSVLQ